jgi:hypothetical protein
MLEKLLAEIRSGSTTSPAVLAERLGTTPQMVEAMMDTLEQMGYLRTIEDSCKDGTCGGCPVAGYCQSPQTKHARIRVLA